MKEDTKGLYLAIILSLVIIFVTNMIFPSSPTPAANQEAVAVPAAETAQSPRQDSTSAPVMAEETGIGLDEA